MASWSTKQTSRLSTAIACVVVLVVVLAVVVVGARSAGERLNPDTGCAYEEILTSDGSCR